jgi:hypothetical protein
MIHHIISQQRALLRTCFDGILPRCSKRFWICKFECLLFFLIWTLAISVYHISGNSWTWTGNNCCSIHITFIYTQTSLLSTLPGLSWLVDSIFAAGPIVWIHYVSACCIYGGHIMMSLCLCLYVGLFSNYIDVCVIFQSKMFNCTGFPARMCST